MRWKEQLLERCRQEAVRAASGQRTERELVLRVDADDFAMIVTALDVARDSLQRRLPLLDRQAVEDVDIVRQVRDWLLAIRADSTHRRIAELLEREGI